MKLPIAVPSDWPTPPLGTIVDTLVPQRDKPEDLTGPVPWVRIEDFDGQYIGGSKSGQGVSAETIESMNLRVFPEGSVVCTCSCSMGTTAIVKSPLVTNQTFIGLVPDTSRLDARFLYYALAAYKPFLDAAATGAIQQYLSRDDFRQLRFPLPALRTQQAVANYLDAETAKSDALVRSLQASIDGLTERYWSLISGAAKIEDWRRGTQTGLIRTRIKYLLRARAGTWGTEPGTSEVDIRCVRAADFDRHRLRVSPDRIPLRSVSWADLDALRLRPGDLVLEKSGGGAGQPVGGAVLFDLDEDAVCSNFAARLRPESGVSPAFLTYLLAALYRRGVTEALGKQTTGIANLDVGGFLAHEVWMPSSLMQVALARQLDIDLGAVDGLMAARSQQISLLLERRQALITAAVTGQHEVSGVAA